MIAEWVMVPSYTGTTLYIPLVIAGTANDCRVGSATTLHWNDPTRTPNDCRVCNATTLHWNDPTRTSNDCRDPLMIAG